MGDARRDDEAGLEALEVCCLEDRCYRFDVAIDADPCDKLAKPSLVFTARYEQHVVGLVD